MAYNQKFYKTESATAHSLTSCAAGTRGVGAYTASAESIISQRDTDRKALVWAQAAAQSLVTCRPDTSVSALNVIPVEGLDSTGEDGGPFTPATVQYTIQNFGNEDCNWQCNASEAWVTVSLTSGFLYVGESVVVTIGLDAAALPEGTHTATITFFNASTGIIVTTRQVVLEVTAAPVACYLTLQDSGVPYPDLVSAQAAILARTAGCMVEQTIPVNPGCVVDLFTASLGGSVLNIARTDSNSTPGDIAEGGTVSFNCYLTAGTLTVGYTLTPDNSPTFLSLQGTLLDEFGATVDAFGDAQFNSTGLSGFPSLNVPSDGFYSVTIQYGTGPAMNLAAALAMTAAISASGTFTVCRVRAEWDDGGGVNYEACV